jgi:hypothetical protein
MAKRTSASDSQFGKINTDDMNLSQCCVCFQIAPVFVVPPVSTCGLPPDFLKPIK